MVGVVWNKRVLMCNRLSALRFLRFTGSTRNKAALTSDNHRLFATEFLTRDYKNILSSFSNNAFSASNIR